MPLNKKGKKILASMEKRYGTKKGKSVFYAMENSGKLKSIKAASGSAVNTAAIPPKKGPNSQVPPIKLNMGGCPNREATNKNIYPGNSSIQVKGFGFQGVK